ncbi:MAG: hypothetical protein ACYSUF_02190 [Planctomycetota bacterium]|jgi:hypothetical protein
MGVVRVKVRVVGRTGTARTRVGCPLTKNRSAWCYRLCAPEAGRGLCGRIAPHALRGRTDLAIEQYLQRRRDDE